MSREDGLREQCANMSGSDNASSLDDMKDMLASLPSFTETRDKVRRFFILAGASNRTDTMSRRVVLSASRNVADMHEYVQSVQVAASCQCRAGAWTRCPHGESADVDVLDQCCATGVTPDGKSPKSLVEDMIPLLSDKTLS